MKRALVLVVMLFAACPPSPPRTNATSQSLQTACSSSAECAHDSNGCTYCYSGHCSCVLPADPTNH